jgi:hypothetical protein
MMIIVQNGETEEGKSKKANKYTYDTSVKSLLALRTIFV